MMVDRLQKQMTPLLRQIASSLIEATPEWWTEAMLRVEVEYGPDDELSMSHADQSAEYPQDVVEATDDILAATRALQLLCAKAKKPWSALTFRIEQTGNDWQFSTDFEYPG
jgi:hypothetical protein